MNNSSSPRELMSKILTDIKDDGVNSVKGMLLKTHGPEALTLCVDTVLHQGFLETICYHEKEQILDLIKILSVGQTAFCILAQRNKLIHMTSETFIERKFQTSLLTSEILLTITESHDHQSHPMDAIIQLMKSISCIIDDTEDLNNTVLAILCNLLKVASVSGPEFENILSDAIEDLPSNTLLATLSNITNLLSGNDSLVTSTLSNQTFWSKLIDCLDKADCSIRKRSLFLTNFLISTNRRSITQMDNFMLEDILVVLETLEETQGHIIRPVLAKIPKLYEYALQKRLDIKWISVIFNRLMLQESKMISRWGMQLLLDLTPSAFMTQDGILVLEKLIFSHIHNTFMFYRPNFVSKGESPPIVHQLDIYLTVLLCDFDPSLSQHFLSSLFAFLCRTKTGSIPLTMLTYILSKIKLPYKVKTGCVNAMANMCRTVLPTQPHKVKGAVQGFLLQFLSSNAEIDSKEMLCSFRALLDLLTIEFVLDGDHSVWGDLSLLLKNADNDTSFELFVSHEIKAHKNRSLKATGFGLLLALADQQELLTEKSIESVFQPLLNCGTNMYISMHSVIGSATIVNIVFEYYKKAPEKSHILKFSCNSCSHFFENCSLFFLRYSEIVHSGMLADQSHTVQKMKQIALLLANISQYCMRNQNKEEMFLANVLSSFKTKDSETLAMQQCSVLLHAFHKTGSYKNIGGSEIPSNTDWLLPYLASESLATLEGSWTCFSFLSHFTPQTGNMETSYNLFNLAVEGIQKMSDPFVIKMVFNFIRHIMPDIIGQNSKLLCDSIPFSLVMLQDFSNVAVYWDLLSSFCAVIFNTIVMDNPECIDAVIKTVKGFKDLTNSKEMVMSHVVRSLVQYTSCNMENISHYLDLLMDMTLFGVSTSREKQNNDDLIAFIENLGDELPVNCVYKGSNKGVPLVRVQIINMLYIVVEKFPDLSSKVAEFYLTSFRSIEKSALQNSLPNRTKIRIFQALLCLLPAIIKQMDDLCVEKLMKSIMLCFTLDSQPSVRCFIECCICFILSKHSDLISVIYEMIGTSRKVTNCNAFLTAIFSILYHHMKYLHEVTCLTQPLLDETIRHVGVWACSNNHNVRTVASACLVLLSDVYSQNYWDMPPYYKMQVDFITQSPDYKKLDTSLIQKNVYFSKFNIHGDLCLFNIFYSLPQQLNVLENECIGKRDLEGFISQMAFPAFSGDFHELPKPKTLEQKDFLIRFSDLTEFTSLQRKTTPWQIMATNLGIDFDRSSTVKGELVLFASLIDKANNLGGLSRTSEIFGVKTMVVNNTEIINNKDFKALSMTSEKWISFEEVPYNTASTVEYFKTMKRQGYTIVGVEQTSDSVTLEQFEFPKKSVLVLGRERDGISVELLSHLDVCVEIPQLGLVRSLNVHVSASIMIWEYSKQHLFAKGDIITDGC